MRQAIHANCIVPDGLRADVLLTDEPAVAARAGTRHAAATLVPEQLVDPDLAHRTSVAMWRAAFTWFRRGDEDPTIVEGISAGDIAGLESALAVLLPAARGALSMAATIHREGPLQRLVSVTPHGTEHGARYDRLEGLAAEAAITAARHLSGPDLVVERIASSEPGNELLRDKYARTRDPEFLLTRNAVRTAQHLVYAAANRVALLRRRRSSTLLVVEYNPTLAFSRAYLARPGPRRRLLRRLADPRDVAAAAWAGDLVQAPAAARPGQHAGVERQPPPLRDDDPATADLRVDGIPLWETVDARLREILSRYVAYVGDLAPRLAAELSAHQVEAVLVPFDTNPATRVLVRVAQSLSIPTFVTNDGYKGDEVQIEGLSTDVALASSEAVATAYFRRHPGRTFVTGNPKFARLRESTWRAPARDSLHVLVGSFTFSPVDLNCRRADAEDFLDGVLAGIALASPEVDAAVTVKLHPADEPAHYRDLLDRHPGLSVTLLTEGDVTDLFSRADLYVTTYSTSLLEAAVTMPVIYFRVNAQRVGPPFDDDDFLKARTASSPAELAAVLRDRATLGTPPSSQWLLRYLGPDEAEARMIEVIEAELSAGPAGPGSPTAPTVVRPG